MPSIATTSRSSLPAGFCAGADLRALYAGLVAAESREVKARDVAVFIDRIHVVMHHFKAEPATRKSIAPSQKLWTALQALDGYLTGQSNWLVNYAERHRAGLRVGTAITEGTANFLVNRRMNKSQQMRWSRRGADLLLQVRCAVYNGTLGSGFGQKFWPANDPYPPTATAAWPPKLRQSHPICAPTDRDREKRAGSSTVLT